MQIHPNPNTGCACRSTCIHPTGNESNDGRPSTQTWTKGTLPGGRRQRCTCSSSRNIPCKGNRTTVKEKKKNDTRVQPHKTGSKQREGCPRYRGMNKFNALFSYCEPAPGSGPSFGPGDGGAGERLPDGLELPTGARTPGRCTGTVPDSLRMVDEETKWGADA